MYAIEAHVTEIADKTFVDCHKHAKVFSLESFRLYGICVTVHHIKACS